MIDLIKLFESVAKPRFGTKLISHIGIDINGTLYRDGKVDQLLADMYKFFGRESTIDAHLITTSQKQSIKSLLEVKAEPRLLNISSKDDFYASLEEMGTDALVIDDMKPASKRVGMYIHPQNPLLRRFLEQRLYAKEPLPVIIL